MLRRRRHECSHEGTVRTEMRAVVREAVKGGQHRVEKTQPFLDLKMTGGISETCLTPTCIATLPATRPESQGFHWIPGVSVWVAVGWQLCAGIFSEEPIPLKPGLKGYGL